MEATIPNSHRKCRVSPDYWQRMLNHRCRGFATLTSEPDTVLCYNMYHPDVAVVRPVSDFRKTRQTRTKAKTVEVKQTEVERFGLVNNIGADYS